MSQTFEFQYRTVLKEVGLAEYAVGALAKQFERLTELLTEWNRKTNLTAITDLEGILPILCWLPSFCRKVVR